jgi:predicted phage-related endonuclease
MSDLWHDLRSKNIGGSEAAALFGECPYMTYFQLWHIKRGNLDAANLDDDERVQAGRFQEPAAIEWANWKWGFDFYRPNIYLEHGKIQGMACTPDAYSKSDPLLMSQIKIVDGRRFNIESGWQYDGDEIIRAPLHILLQIQHELEVSQKKISYLIVMVGGNRLFKMQCHYDEQIGAILRKKVRAFWLSETPPEPDFKRDGQAIREIKSSLPHGEFEDFSGDRDLKKLIAETKALQVAIAKKTDALEEKKTEIYYYSKNLKTFKCGEFFVQFYNSKGGPMFKIINNNSPF